MHRNLLARVDDHAAEIADERLVLLRDLHEHVDAAFLTGDLFNLFVSFEVMLTASYVLITLGGRRDQVRAGMTYVVISLVASALFLTTLGLVYASAGTVNLADLAGRFTDLPVGVRLSLALLLLESWMAAAGGRSVADPSRRRPPPEEGGAPAPVSGDARVSSP